MFSDAAACILAALVGIGLAAVLDSQRGDARKAEVFSSKAAR